MTGDAVAVVSMSWPQYQRAHCQLDGRLVKLRHCEAEVLSILLLGHPDCFLTIEHFIEILWPNPDDEPVTAGDNWLSVYITKLRKRGVVILSRLRNRGRIIDNYGGYRIPAYARGREPLRIAA